MKYFIWLGVVMLGLIIVFACQKQVQAASGDVSPVILAKYSTAKTSACVKGSIAYSRSRVFVCTTTAIWKKATLN